MKTLMLSLLAVVLLTSCDPNSDKRVGNESRFAGANNNNNGTGGGSGSGGGGNTTGSSGTPTDAPLDGGLAVLLAAGAAYGVRKVRNRKTDAGA